MAAELPEANIPTELWDGEIVMSPSPRPDHQRVVLRLARCLQDHVRAKQLGEVFVSPLDVVLSPRRVVQPDIIFISQARSGIIQDSIRGAPDLVVEVISEGSWRRDRVEKKDLYEQFGVAEYWVVDLEAKTIEVFALEKAAYRLHSRADRDGKALSKRLRGFGITWSDLVG
jgi:Uma2 family endonuclease